MWRGRPHPRCLKSMKKRVPHPCPCAMSRDGVGDFDSWSLRNRDDLPRRLLLESKSHPLDFARRRLCCKERDPAMYLRCGCFLASRRSKPIPLIHGPPKFLPLLRTHIPASPAPSAPTMPARPAGVQSAEQNPAQRQQSQRLPEPQRPPAEKRRQQPVPQMHDHLPAHE